MIEGIRALPWLEEARTKDGHSDLLTCERCMERNSEQTRRVMRCGYIPESDHVKGMFWQPDGFDLTLCAGYTTSLPEVIDAQKNYHHYDTGQLAAACNGEPPTLLFDLCAMLKGSVLSKESYRTREELKKNGGNRGAR